MLSDPWTYLGQNQDLGGKIDLTVALYKLLMRVGIYGAMITAVIFLAGLALRFDDPRKTAEYKEKVIGKFIVVFLICACAFIASLILRIAQYLSV